MPTTKTSGKKDIMKSGYARDFSGDKLRYDLIPLELLERLAGLYTRGAKLYGDNNWRLSSKEEAPRFLQSAWRHFIQWQRGDTDEDHAAAIIWNVMGYEWITKHKKHD